MGGMADVNYVFCILVSLKNFRKNPFKVIIRVNYFCFNMNIHLLARMYIFFLSLLAVCLSFPATCPSMDRGGECIGGGDVVS